MGIHSLLQTTCKILILLWVQQGLFLGPLSCNSAAAFQPKPQQQQQRITKQLYEQNYYYYKKEVVAFSAIGKFLRAKNPGSSSSCLFLSSSIHQHNDNDILLTSLQIQEEVESSKGLSNTKYLQNQFNLTDTWAKKASSDPGFTTMNRYTLIYRIKWLQLQLDLNDAQCGKIMQRFPQIVKYKPETNLGPTMQFLKKKLAINTMELSKIVQQQPTILCRGIEEDETLQRNLNWMEKRLGLKNRKNKGKAVLNCPSLLTLSVVDNLDPSFQMLQERFEISEKQTAKMCRDFPRILQFNFTTKIEPTRDMLQQRLDLNSTQLGKLCTVAPQILGYNYTTNLEPKLDLLQERMDLNSTELGLFCLKAPTILGLNYTTNIEPTLQWLQDRLHLSKNELRKIIKSQPTLLGLDPDNTFVPRLTWLQDRLSLDDAAVKKMIIPKPQILCYAIEKKMEPLLQWLEKTLSLDDQGIQTIMVKYPALFSYNITTNLNPTLDFFKICIGEEEALDLVRQQPYYFGFSLKRMQERYDQMCELGVEVNSKILWRIAQQKKPDWDAFIKRCQKEKDGT